MKLELLDEIILLGQGSVRSLECILALEISHLPGMEYLKDGVLLAQGTFPKTASHPVRINHYSNLETFINEPLPSIWHLEEGIIRKDNKIILALKMSHVLGDAVSMLLWLKCQLGEKILNSEIRLQTFPAKKDSPHRSLLPSEAWPLSAKISSERKLKQFSISHEEKYGDFSINDLLSLAILKSLPGHRKSLWVPVNIREKAWEGFGNGLSRMRIYPARTKLSAKEELQFIKRQKKEARTSGEIFSPSLGTKIDTKIKKSLLKLWLNRPWADWGSISFSHLHDRNNILEACEGVWGVSNLPEKQQAGIFAFTKGQKTWLTLTMDSTSFDEARSNQIIEEVTSHFDQIARSLND